MTSIKSNGKSALMEVLAEHATEVTAHRDALRAFARDVLDPRHRIFDDATLYLLQTAAVKHGLYEEEVGVVEEDAPIRCVRYLETAVLKGTP